MFGLRYPVMSAPMTLHCNATLAGAVSAAGGLGSLAGLHPAKGPEWAREEIAAVRATTEAPFAVGFISNLIGFVEPLFEAALDEHPPLMALSFGDPTPWIERCKAAGARVMCQVQTYKDADRAVGAGADLLVAQGNEAGGHTGTMGLLPFLTGVVTRHPDIPVLAAGGIGDGATLAAALMAGADARGWGLPFWLPPNQPKWTSRTNSSSSTVTVRTPCSHTPTTS
jgi:nitronate monooxygenase